MLNEERGAHKVPAASFLSSSLIYRGFLLLSTFSHKQYFTGKKNDQTVKRQTAVFSNDAIKSPENMTFIRMQSQNLKLNWTQHMIKINVYLMVPTRRGNT